MKDESNRDQSVRDTAAPSIAVILPTFNGEAFVRESIESVLSQEFPSFELIVCDDASTDATWSILQEYSSERCKVVRNTENRGLFPTLNRLMEETRSEWVHLWSQDDRMLPGCLMRTSEFARSHPEVGMIYSGRHHVDEAGARLPDGPTDTTPAIVPPLLAARIMYYFGSIAGNIANVTLRRNVFAQIGPFREDLEVSGDFEYWVRLSESHSIGFQSEPLVELRSHGGQFSRQLSSEKRFIEENREIYDSLLARLPADEMKRAIRHKMWVLQVNTFHHAVRCIIRGNLRTAIQVLNLLRNETRLVPLLARWFFSANGRLMSRPSLLSE
jgi:glycosyltransferase involved in cell wall biosynthesis